MSIKIQRVYMINILILIVCTAIPLVIAEIYFRATNPYIIRNDTKNPLSGVVAGDYSYFMDTTTGRRLIPNTNIIHKDNNIETKIRINNLGFRGANFPKDKPPGEMRVIVLGDSITFAIQVPEEQTFVELAMKYMQQPEQNYSKLRIINSGVEGIGIKDEIDILVSQGLSISPDIVVVAFYLNDSNPPDRLAAVLANPGFVRKNSVLAQYIFRAFKYNQYKKGFIRLKRTWFHAGHRFSV